jgi:hypothetical protein
MYVKAEIVRVSASSDKCSCGGTMSLDTSTTAVIQ